MDKYLHIVTVIAVLTDGKGKFLLVQRAADDDIFPLKWQNLGGKVEKGENLENAIRREIKEEIGTSLDEDIQPIYIKSYSWEKDKNEPQRLGIIFEFKIKNQEIKLSEELNDYKWYTFKEVLSLDTIGPEHPTGTIGQLKLCLNNNIFENNNVEEN